MSPRRSLTLLLLAALSPAAGFAQAPEAPAPGTRRTATLQETLSLAAKQSPDVAAARAQAAIAAAGVRRAWTAWQPDLSLGAQFVHTNAPATFDLGAITGLVGGVFGLAPVNPGAIPGPVVITGQNSRYATVQVSQPLFTPAGVFLIGPAKDGARAAEFGALEAREQVLLGVARTYLGLQGILQLMDAAREAETVALQREGEAKAQLAVGMTVEAALLRAQTETAQARVQLAQLSGQYTQLLALLGALVGEPVQPTVFEEAGTPRWVIPPEDQTPWEDTFAVRAAALAVKASEGKVRFDRFSWLPSLVAQGKGLYNSNTGFTGRNTSYELAVAASLPLYDRGQRYAALREDEARLEQSRAQFASTRAKAHANWVAAQANLEAARAALTQAEAQAQLAARVQQQVAAGYKAGVATSLEMSDADNRRFLAASNAAQARASLEVRRVELAASAGRIAASLEPAGEQSTPR
ncbi:TolC family protein [Archangium primigenium]|uniref:TolC family protein n=1 Tax=[Archangium] primigenium TaxID=2792470 RepID=UPI0019567885|nr:TolC family protein [Archangium primigenium]MBM7119376.1 TolC family protein [Archangium primigenium]